MVLKEFFDGRSAQYAKRIEYLMESRLMSQGLKCFEPCVDDDGTDCVIKTPSGQFFEIQIKARKGEAGTKGIGRFEVRNPELRHNYYYLFYAETQDIMWLFSSEQYLKACSRHKSGKNMNKTWIILLNDSGSPAEKYKEFEVKREDFKKIFK